jgi:Holliday junction resolvase RusA-like endonuclease
MKVTISLSGPPRGKGAGRAGIGGGGSARIFTDERTRKYESQLRFAAQQEMAGRSPTPQPVTVTVEARFQIPTTWSEKKRKAALAGHIWPTVRPDCENLIKALDAFNGVVWIDDKQIIAETVHKIYSERPGLTVVIETIEPRSALAVSPVQSAGPLFDQSALGAL